MNTPPLARINVGVVVERRAATSPWIDHVWRPIGVLTGAPEAAAWTPLPGASGADTFYAGAADIALYRSETTNYRDNLASGQPSLWVVLRPTGTDPPFSVVTVTADPAEGEAFTETATDLVEAVPMPEAIAEAVAGFIAEHHIEHPFQKRKRDRVDPRGPEPPQRRGEMMSEGFLSRWSRRKRAASIPPPASEASGGEGGERSEPGGGPSTVGSASVAERQEPPTPDPSPPFAARTGGGEPEGSAREEEPFDPATLPAIESIRADTDISAFLRPGVPADLAQAALRRAWVADPAIRDFIGPAENAWDFNAPDGVPGFGPLRAIDDVRRLAAEIAGVMPAAAPEEAAGEQPSDVAAADTSSERAPASAPKPPDDAAAQNSAPGEQAASLPNPRHDGA